MTHTKYIQFDFPCNHRHMDLIRKKIDTKHKMIPLVIITKNIKRKKRNLIKY